MKRWRLLTDRSLTTILLIVSLLALSIPIAPVVSASNDLLDGRYDKLSNPNAGAISNHQIGFTVSELSIPVGSISLQFCSNSPLLSDPCIAPTGFNANGASLATQSGETGFSISGLSTDNRIILTRAPALPSGIPAVYEFTNIINPTDTGTSYLRIDTFTSIDVTGLNIEEGGVAYAINPGINVSAEVPPYLRFCAAVTITGFDCSSATSFLVDFGEFNTSQTAGVTSEFLVATNASFGYSVAVSGTTMTSGNNIIPPLFPAGSPQPGTSQFGLNLRANTTPNIGAEPVGPGTGSVSAGYNMPNSFRFQNGDIIATSNSTNENKKFTVTYAANISENQPAGFYATTLTYICLANF